jgi:hypothetical protein
MYVILIGGSRSPFTGGRGWNIGKSYGEIHMPEHDISYINPGRHSVDRIFSSGYDSLDHGGSHTPPRMSHSEIDNHNFESTLHAWRSLDATSPPHEFSSITSHDSDSLSNSPHSMVRTHLFCASLTRRSNPIWFK